MIEHVNESIERTARANRAIAGRGAEAGHHPLQNPAVLAGVFSSDDRRAVGSWVPPIANLAVIGITRPPNPKSKNAKKPRPSHGFLAKSITCSRQITATDQSIASEFFTDD
jgi:hypothetical protein